MSLLRRIFGHKTVADGGSVEDRAHPAPSTPGEPAQEATFLRAALTDDRRDDILLRFAAGRMEGTGREVDHATALLLGGWRRFREAATIYRRLVEAENASHDLLLDAAWCEHMNGRFDDALVLLDRAVARSPDAATRFARGVVKLSLDRPAEARDELATVAQQDPAYRDVWLNLAMAEAAAGDAVAAEASLRKAIAAAPRSAAAWCRWGRTLMLMGRTDEAIDAYTRARVLERETGEDVRTTALHAVALYETGHYQAAVDLCEARLPAEPDATANTAYSLALLTLGRYVPGWDQYEFRWFDEPMRSHRARYDRPFWMGQPLSGKTVLLRGEQGIGDVVQFARYASLLAKMGACVRFHVREDMVELAKGFHDVHDVVHTLEMPPRFDFHVNVMSVPRILGTTLATIPASFPYLGVAPVAAAKWRARIRDARVRVGLVWAGNPKHPRDSSRSVPLRTLAPLWGIEGVHYYSLQKEVPAADADHFPDASLLTRLGSNLDDLTDAAAAIDELDLLIAVDTSLAHIAGALAKPVWLMLPELPDFRWMTSREDSPWYPTMRLFRQADGSGWPEVIDRIAAILRRVASGDDLLGNRVVVPPPQATVDLPQGMPRVGEMRDGIMQFLPDRDDEARSLAAYGEYLVGELDLIANLIPIDAWVLEAGSGCGSHALPIARMLEGRGELLVYEADSRVERILRQNLESNGLLDSVTLPRGSLEPRRGVLHGVSGPLHDVDDLALRRLDLLKLRSQEADRILSGATRTLWQARPRVLAAASDEPLRLRLIGILHAHGYRTWCVRLPFFRPDNYNAWPGDVFGGRAAEILLAIPEEAEAGTYLANRQEVC